MSARRPTGRPEAGEYADYAAADLASVPGDDAVAALEASGRATQELLAPLGEDAVAGLTYAPGKWTLKEIVGHLADDERIFVYRAQSVARGDETPQPAFDEELYVATAGFEDRSLADLLAELRIVRRATLAFFAGLPDDAWRRTAGVNDYRASPRGLAFHIAGHELHHLRVIEERYLPLLPDPGAGNTG